MGMDCKYCGAYISSDVEKCPACGKRVSKSAAPGGAYGYGGSSSASASASARAYAPEREDRAEREEKAYTYKDEYSRRYGSEEYETRERGESAPRVEYKDRAEEYRSKARDYGHRAEEFVKRNTADDTSKYRLVSYLSYFGPLFLVPFLLYKDVEFCRFHANQGLLLLLANVILNIFGWNFVGLIFTIFCIVRGLRSVSRGTMERLPFIGGIKLL